MLVILTFFLLLIKYCFKYKYRVSHNWIFTLFLLFWRLLLILIAKVEAVLKNSGNLLHDMHKNFENRFRNSWDNWGQSCHLSHRFFFLPLCISKISISKMTGGNFGINYLSYFWIDFQNSCAYHVANFQAFSKIPQLLHFGWTLPEKMAKNKVKTDLWDTL